MLPLTHMCTSQLVCLPGPVVDCAMFLDQIDKLTPSTISSVIGTVAASFTIRPAVAEGRLEISCRHNVSETNNFILQLD